MTHVYYDPGSGDLLHTATLAPGIDPARLGAYWIEAEAAPADLFAWQVVEGELVERSAVTPELRAAAIERINGARGAAREQFITVLPGQEMVYLDKERQALAFLADNDPQPDDYPAIFAEVGVTGETALAVAQVVAGMGAQWRQVSAVIEGACLGAIAAVEQAKTMAQVEAAEAGAATALTGLGAGAAS